MPETNFIEASEDKKKKVDELLKQKKDEEDNKIKKKIAEDLEEEEEFKKFECIYLNNEGFVRHLHFAFFVIGFLALGCCFVIPLYLTIQMKLEIQLIAITLSVPFVSLFVIILMTYIVNWKSNQDITDLDTYFDVIRFQCAKFLGRKKLKVYKEKNE